MNILCCRLEVIDRNSETVTVKSGNNKAVIIANPFKVEFYQSDSLVAVVNARGLFALEHLIPKKPQV